MPRPPRQPTAAPSHRAPAPSRPAFAGPHLELPAPPPSLSPAGRTEWARLSAWAERTLQEQALSVFFDYCAAAGDLASARSTWMALGSPMFVERIVSPHTGLAAHPALSVIDGLTRQKLRLGAAINLLPARIAAQPQQPPVVDDVGSGVVGFDTDAAARFFN